eukprot:4952981-Pyramimonas_sp.AAC.2
MIPDTVGPSDPNSNAAPSSSQTHMHSIHDVLHPHVTFGGWLRCPISNDAPSFSRALESLFQPLPSFSPHPWCSQLQMVAPITWLILFRRAWAHPRCEILLRAVSNFMTCWGQLRIASMALESSFVFGLGGSLESPISGLLWGQTCLSIGSWAGPFARNARPLGPVSRRAWRMAQRTLIPWPKITPKGFRRAPMVNPGGRAAPPAAWPPQPGRAPPRG